MICLYVRLTDESSSIIDTITMKNEIIATCTHYKYKYTLHYPSPITSLFCNQRPPATDCNQISYQCTIDNTKYIIRNMRSNGTPSSKAAGDSIKISNVGDKVKRGDGIKWKGLMKKLAFESKGLKKKLKNLTNSSNKGLLDNIPGLPKHEVEALELLLQAFTTRHQSHHRPIALVTSGGTATDLEVRAVRYLDNFSTGLRGAISVEEFLKRGYAVIHLWREGSAAPYSRVLSQLLGSKQGNHALSFDALGRLFAGQHQDDDLDQVEKTNNDDPWLSSPPSMGNNSGEKSNTADTSRGDESETSGAESTDLNLGKRIANSTILQTKLRERADVVKAGMLLTVSFRTVEQYLAKLKMCTEAINDCQSLGLIYLTAAVSDFYIPKDQKAEHKIQSRDYGINNKNGDTEEAGNKNTAAESAVRMDPETNCLHLKMSPVPKVLTLVRDDFAPNAFCVSFKLETDKDILFEKARIAIRKYDMHMVIGNVLETRYEKVWILQNRGIYVSEEDEDLTISQVSKNDAPSSSADALEDAIISHVIEKHFEYIANYYLMGNDDENDAVNGVMPRTALMAGAEAAARHNEYLRDKKRQLQNELYWKRVRDNTLNVAGHALGMYISYWASTALQKRMR